MSEIARTVEEVVLVGDRNRGATEMVMRRLVRAGSPKEFRELHDTLAGMDDAVSRLNIALAGIASFLGAEPGAWAYQFARERVVEGLVRELEDILVETEA